MCSERFPKIEEAKESLFFLKDGCRRSCGTQARERTHTLETQTPSQPCTCTFMCSHTRKQDLLYVPICSRPHLFSCCFSVLHSSVICLSNIHLSLTGYLYSFHSPKVSSRLEAKGTHTATLAVLVCVCVCERERINVHVRSHLCVPFLLQIQQQTLKSKSRLAKCREMSH